MTGIATTRVREALRAAQRMLQPVSDTAALDAAVLLRHASGWTASRLAAADGEALDPGLAESFFALVRRRESGEPIAYITGRREFWSLDLEVSPATLIPRPDTETLVEAVLERGAADRPLRFLDLGTGSGNIALAVARERPRWRVTAAEIDTATRSVAARNFARLEPRIELVDGSWFDSVPGRIFDLVAGNPPYIASSDPHLGQGDLRFEPRRALASGTRGMDDIEQICRNAPRHLNPGGWLILEHGADQAAPVRECLLDAGFDELFCDRDLAGNDRVSGGRLR